MADLQAFKGIRYELGKVGQLDNVVAPPYDVIDPDLQDHLYKVNDFNVVRLILNRVEPSDDENARYARAGQFIKKWRQEGILVEENQPSIYVYHQTFQLNESQVTRKGFMGRVRLEPLGSGRIFPHEHTHAAAKADRLRLMTATQCNLSPIFSLYPDNDNTIQSLLDKAIDGTAALTAIDHLGVKHEMWPISDLGTISKVTALFGPMSLFIADGHHRYETSLNYLNGLTSNRDLPNDHPARYTLMMCVGMSDPGLAVLPTHRLFRGIEEQVSNSLVSRIEKYFDCKVHSKGIENAEQVWQLVEEAGEQNSIGLYCPADSTWVIATLNLEGIDRLAELVPDKSDAYRNLGVSILHELLIPEFFPDSKDLAPKYVRSTDELVEGIKTGDKSGRDATGQSGFDAPFGLAAIVLPASVEDVQEICTAGERMPAKSTYFYPKMLSGLVINPLS